MAIKNGGGLALGQDRTCIACSHDHPVGTTCRECPRCRTTVPVLVAEEVFADPLPGEAEWQTALVHYNHNLGQFGRCDGDCHLDDCDAPHYDESGLPTHRRPVATTSSHTDARPHTVREVRGGINTPPSERNRPAVEQPYGTPRRARGDDREL